MRLFLTTCLVLIFFAANSVLARAALVDGAISPGAFTAIRLASGAVVLSIIVLYQRHRPWSAGTPAGALSLFGYAAALSFSYIAIPTGLGALILFGAVQITMFAGSVIRGARPSARRWSGSALGLTGLAILALPGANSPPLWAAIIMGLSGVSWGVYSLIGVQSQNPTGTTAGNFLYATPLAVLTWLLLPGQAPETTGIILAVISGGITSGLGYALWYTILPRLDPPAAALSQLTVPLIALAGGMVFLAEPPDLRFLLCATLILGGVALGLLPARKKLP